MEWLFWWAFFTFEQLLYERLSVEKGRWKAASWKTAWHSECGFIRSITWILISSST